MILTTEKIHSMTEFEILSSLTPITYEAVQKNYSSDKEFVTSYLNEVNKTKETYFIGPDEYVRKQFVKRKKILKELQI